MNRLRNIVGLIAVCATAAFFTGCGDDDHSDNSGPQQNAPASLNGRTYNLADNGGTSVIAFDQNANYTLTPSGGGAVETGTATSNQSGDVWTSSLVATGAATNSTLTLTFTAPGSGTYTFDRPGEPLVSGNFSEQTTPGNTDGPNPTTDGGTTNGGTVPAPATVPNQITFTTGPGGGIGEGTVYTATFSGGTSGTFTTANTSGDSVGSGNFQYTPQGNQAHLRMDYTSAGAVGDFDDATLIFTQQAGSGQPNTYTGNQQVTGNPYTFNGTFTY